MEERAPTDPAIPVVVNVNRDTRKRNGNGVTMTALATVVGLAVGGVGFFATYIFVTKPELALHKHAKTESVHKIETQQALTDASVRQLTKEVEKIQVEQRLTNKNLNKLLRRSRITPASRESIRIEMEDEE